MIKEKDNCQRQDMVKNELRELVDLESAVQELKKAKSNELVIFVGAGISKDPPSSCPLSKELMDLVIDSAKSAHSGLDDFHSFINCRTKRIKPELFCQILHSNLRENFFGFIDILNMGIPNCNHSNIAYIAREYKIPIVLTTNFDTYIEKALEKVSLNKYKLYVNSVRQGLLNSLNNKGSDESHLPVVKLHGTLDEKASIIFTLRLAGLNLKKDLSDLLRVVFRSYTVLIVGYSGNDDDIFPVILSTAKTAKGVYWVLRNNEVSLTGNIKAFGRECPNCKLVGADQKSIFARLLDKDADEKYDQGKEDKMKTRQNKFLLRWASGINEMAWKNFFSEIILLDPSKEEATFIAAQSDKIIRGSDDPWLVTKALKNHGLALIVLKEYEKALESLLKTADRYMNMGRHREVIECLSMMVAKIPGEWEWRGNDPLFWTSWLSGKTYDPYCLGLSSYAEGLCYLRKGRMDLAQKRLFVAGGYAKQCGDSITLVNCLESLSKVFNIAEDKKREDQCLTEVGKIKKALGVVESDVKNKERDKENEIKENEIIAMCKSKVEKEKQFLMGGEIGLFIVVCIISAILAKIISPSAWFLALTWAVVKVWNVKKKFRYTCIDRT